MEQASLEAQFPRTEQNASRDRLAAIGAGVMAVGLTVAAYKTGLTAEAVDVLTVSPQPGAATWIVDGMVAVNEGIRQAALPAAGAAALAGGYFAYQGRKSDYHEMVNELSKSDLSGIDSMTEAQRGNNFMSRINEKTLKLRRGTAIAATAIVLTGVTSGIENEVSNGALRPIKSMFGMIAPEAKTSSMVLQAPDATLMDGSTIPQAEMQRMERQAQQQRVPLIPFSAKLIKIDNMHAVEFSIPDNRFQELAHKLNPGDVKVDAGDVPAIVDDTLGKKPGEAIDFSGVPGTVVAVKKDMAQMNRNIAIIPQTAMREKVLLGADSSYFGAIAPNVSRDKLAKLVMQNPNTPKAALTDEHFEDTNRDFWHKNGTPILLQTIGYLGIFTVISVIGERLSALRRNLSAMGKMQVSGVGTKDFIAIENRRALRDTGRAAIIAAPLMPIMATVLNAAEVGLKVGVGARELAVGVTMTLGAKLLGTRRAMKKFQKDLDLSKAIKG